MSTVLSPQQRRDLSTVGLDVPLGAKFPTQEAIRRAYRERARNVHPDVNPSGDSQAFIALQAAYENLTSPVSSSSSSATAGPKQPGAPRTSSAGASTRSGATRPTSGAAGRKTSTAAPSSSSSATSGATSPRKQASTFSQSLRGGNGQQQSSSSASAAAAAQRRRTNSGLNSSTSSNSSSAPGGGMGAASSSSGGYVFSGTAPPPPALRNASKPFLAFLPGGASYTFETDSVCFGSYAAVAKHGDSARLLDGSEQCGVIIGVAGDNNLYWWQINSATGTMSTEATVLSSKVSSPSSTKFVVVKVQQHQQQPPCSPSAASSSSANSSSYPSSMNSTPMRAQHSSSSAIPPVPATSSGHRLESIDRDVNHFEELEEEESEGRRRVEMLRQHWVSEAWWCSNFPKVAAADSNRYSRTMR